MKKYVSGKRKAQGMLSHLTF